MNNNKTIIKRLLFIISGLIIILSMWYNTSTQLIYNKNESNITYSYMLNSDMYRCKYNSIFILVCRDLKTGEVKTITEIQI